MKYILERTVFVASPEGEVLDKVLLQITDALFEVRPVRVYIKHLPRLLVSND